MQVKLTSLVKWREVEEAKAFVRDKWPSYSPVIEEGRRVLGRDDSILAVWLWYTFTVPEGSPSPSPSDLPGSLRA